jgi:uncharacterized membrane protein
VTITRTILLVGSVLCSGLMAGLFAAFAYAVMPGLRRADDRTVVVAMQRINVAIVNPLFLILFAGGLLLAGAAWWSVRSDPLGVWALVAAVLYLVAAGITIAVNVPLNNALAAAGSSDPATARAAFENRWVTANIVRAVLHLAGFATIVVGLVVASPT